MSRAEIDPVAVVALPFPSQSHLNQLLHFSLILSARGIPVHFAAPSPAIRKARTRIHGWNSASLLNIHFHELPLPQPPPNSPPPSPFEHTLRLFETPLLLRPAIAALFRSLSPSYRRLVVVHDSFLSVAGLEAAAVPNANSYTFQCVSAFQSIYELRDLHPDRRRPTAEFHVNAVVDAEFDGWVPAPILDSVKRLEHDTPVELGIIANSCRALEEEFIDLLSKEHDGKKVFAVSPLHLLAAMPAPAAEKRHRCLKWLDEQPAASVVYISFGSTVTLSNAQVEQLAIGLRRSGQRFIWVIRKADDGAITSEVKDGAAGLPAGFEDEMDGVGMVLTDWAPQVEILGHVSTTAFISHCGWNSIMESLSNAVPIIAWPMMIDQPRNAMVVTEYLKVGVMVREWGRRKEVVPAARVEELVKMMVEGDEGREMRARATKIRGEIKRDVGEGGTSLADLNSFVDQIRRRE